MRVTDRRRLHHPSCLPFEGRWQRRQALTERSRKGLHLRGAAGAHCHRRGDRLARRYGTARASWAGTRPARPPTFRRAREGELGRRAKRSWPGPRLGAPFCQTGCPPFVMTPQSRPAAVPAPLKGEPGLADAAHLLLQYKGECCHPIGPRRPRICTISVASLYK